MWRYTTRELKEKIEGISLYIQGLKKFIKNSPFGSPLHKKELVKSLERKKGYKHEAKVRGIV
tara:strand:- start:293 stop:478 length:186 start_codon:yes stop_codon:yes gene_type:complete